MFKAKLYAILAGIFAFLIGIIKVLSFQKRQYKRERDQAEADLEFRNEVDEMDSEFEQDFSDRQRAAEKDIENNEIPEHLRNPRA